MTDKSTESAEAGSKFDPSRRRWLTAAAGLPLAGLAAPGLASAHADDVAAARARALAQAHREMPAASPAGGLNGAAADFAIAGTYLNGAYMHPIGRGSADAIKHYLDARLMNAGADSVDMGGDRQRAMNAFGALFHADQDELAWVASTMAGENRVVRGLGLPGSKQRVVTDAYHFSGSLFMYSELAKQGLDVDIVRQRDDHRIHLEDLDRAITPGTKLVALTLVSSVGGFEHDLKAVCDLAHSRGAMVYADLIQAAGNTPIDLHASGVDFAACATYKWLMGDFGIGIMYARRESQQALMRTQWGYRQEGHVVSHFLPFDPPGAHVLDTERRPGLGGLVEVGTLGNGGVAALANSLEWLQQIGIDNIEKWRQPMIARLQEAMPKLGLTPMTPPDSRSSIVSFACEGAYEKLTPKLKAAGVEVTVYRNYLRVSPSFYNSLDDVERLIEALK